MVGGWRKQYSRKATTDFQSNMAYWDRVWMVKVRMDLHNPGNDAFNLLFNTPPPPPSSQYYSRGYCQGLARPLNPRILWFSHSNTCSHKGFQKSDLETFKVRVKGVQMMGKAGNTGLRCWSKCRSNLISLCDIYTDRIVSSQLLLLAILRSCINCFKNMM
jgi:hypothetical protein